MARIVIIFFIFYVSACYHKQAQIPNLTDAVDSLIQADKCNEVVPIIQSLLITTKNDSLKAQLYIRYGQCKEILNQSDSGIFFFNQAANIWKSQGDTEHLVIVYTILGNTYVGNRNYREAMSDFSEALKISSNSIDSIEVSNAICVAYINQEDYKSAYITIKKVLMPYEDKMTPMQSYYIYFGQGLYFNSIKKYDSALSYLQAALHRTANDSYKANTYTNIADVYKSKQDFSTALNYLDSAGLLYQGDGWDDNKQYDFDTYREIYDSLGKYKLAYHYAQLYRGIADSMYNAENKDAMINAVATAKTMEARAETDKAKADSKLKERSLIFTVAVLILVFFLAVVAFRNIRIKQKANQLLTQQKQQVQQLADQLAIANDTKARLFSTIGHDLRSPVSSLYASLKMQELKGNAAGNDMSEQTVRLLDTLEELLIWSKSQMDGFKVQFVKINVHCFFEDLKDFYSDAATAKNILVVNNTAKDVVVRADENLLKTIFRNAISNAIANTSTGNTVCLTAQPAKDGTICMAVNNSCNEESFLKFKTSFEEAVVKSGDHGLGIVLMKEFAQKLGGRIDLHYTNGNASVNLCV